MPKAVVARMRRERAKGLSYAAIAEKLHAAGVPTARGGRRWYPATVRYTLGNAAARR
jgi:hypothetical protein